MNKSSLSFTALFLALAALFCAPSAFGASAPQEKGATRVEQNAKGRSGQVNHPHRFRSGGYRGHHYPGHYRGWHHYGPYFGYGYPHYYPVYPYRAANTGAVDLNVGPKKTKVYLNGYYIGKTNKYDGWPGYLWLPEGNYELIFYLDGYKTIRKEIEVVADVVLRAEFTMEAGESTPAESLTTAVEDRKSERQQLYDRYSKNRTRGGNAMPAGEGAPNGEQVVTVESAYLELDINPSDAVIYLDGRFLGTGKGLAANHGKLAVTEGVHTLEVMRPGHATQKTTFDAVPGKVLRLSITLDVESEKE